MDELIKTVLEHNSIPIIASDTNYWFVRTNGGEYFDRFFFENYIAIEWDEISDIKDLKDSTHNEIREKVKKYYPDESRPGLVASYMLQFVNEMKSGDIILVPNKGSEMIAFGKIVTEAYLHQPTFDEKMEFEDSGPLLIKRRKVEWLHDKPLKRKNIDPLLSSIIYAHNTIVDANPYSSFINRTLYNIYYKDGKLHAIFNIKKTDNVLVVDLFHFIGSIFEAGELCGEILGEKSDRKDLAIKSSINSPGPVELITGATSFLIVLTGLGLFLNGAKLDFDFSIFGLTKGKVKVDSPGILEKIKLLTDKKQEHKIKLKQLESRLLESREKLQIDNKE